MVMTYDKRNRENIAKLADNTKAAALKWYEFCVKNGIDILVYETIRTKQTQALYVDKGVSQTMKSYHIVGQALDFVPVVNGKTDWNGYGSTKAKKAIAEAKRLGFEWGGDWKKFVDKPHLQFNYKGYGTDTFGKVVAAVTPKATVLKRGDTGPKVEVLQKRLSELGYHITVDGIFGEGTENDVKDFQKVSKLAIDGMVGPATQAKLDAAKPANKPAPAFRTGEATADVWLHNKPDVTVATRVRVLEKGSKWKVYGEVNGMYSLGNNAYVAKRYIKIV